MNNLTDVPQFLGDLKGGVAEKQLGLFLSTVAGAVITHGKSRQSYFGINRKPNF